MTDGGRGVRHAEMTSALANFIDDCIASGALMTAMELLEATGKLESHTDPYIVPDHVKRILSAAAFQQDLVVSDRIVGLLFAAPDGRRLDDKVIDLFVSFMAGLSRPDHVRAFAFCGLVAGVADNAYGRYISYVYRNHGVGGIEAAVRYASGLQSNSESALNHQAWVQVLNQMAGVKRKMLDQTFECALQAAKADQQRTVSEAEGGNERSTALIEDDRKWHDAYVKGRSALDFTLGTDPAPASSPAVAGSGSLPATSSGNESDAEVDSDAEDNRQSGPKPTGFRYLSPSRPVMSAYLKVLVTRGDIVDAANAHSALTSQHNILLPMPAFDIASAALDKAVQLPKGQTDERKRLLLAASKMFRQALCGAVVSREAVPHLGTLAVSILSLKVVITRLVREWTTEDMMSEIFTSVMAAVDASTSISKQMERDLKRDGYGSDAGSGYGSGSGGEGGGGFKLLLAVDADVIDRAILALSLSSRNSLEAKDKAIRLFRRLQEFDVPAVLRPRQETYDIMLSLYARIGDETGAQRIYKAMKKLEFSPSPQSLVKLHQLRQARLNQQLSAGGGSDGDGTGAAAAAPDQHRRVQELRDLEDRLFRAHHAQVANGGSGSGSGSSGSSASDNDEDMMVGNEPSPTSAGGGSVKVLRSAAHPFNRLVLNYFAAQRPDLAVKLYRRMRAECGWGLRFDVLRILLFGFLYTGGRDVHGLKPEHIPVSMGGTLEPQQRNKPNRDGVEKKSVIPSTILPMLWITPDGQTQGSHAVVDLTSVAQWLAEYRAAYVTAARRARAQARQAEQKAALQQQQRELQQQQRLTNPASDAPKPRGLAAVFSQTSDKLSLLSRTLSIASSTSSTAGQQSPSSGVGSGGPAQQRKKGGDDADDASQLSQGSVILPADLAPFVSSVTEADIRAAAEHDARRHPQICSTGVATSLKTMELLHQFSLHTTEGEFLEPPEYVDVSPAGAGAAAGSPGQAPAVAVAAQPTLRPAVASVASALRAPAPVLSPLEQVVREDELKHSQSADSPEGGAGGGAEGADVDVVADRSSRASPQSGSPPKRASSRRSLDRDDDFISEVPALFAMAMRAAYQPDAALISKNLSISRSDVMLLANMSAQVAIRKQLPHRMLQFFLQAYRIGAFGRPLSFCSRSNALLPGIRVIDLRGAGPDVAALFVLVLMSQMAERYALGLPPIFFEDHYSHHRRHGHGHESSQQDRRSQPGEKSDAESDGSSSTRGSGGSKSPKSTPDPDEGPPRPSFGTIAFLTGNDDSRTTTRIRHLLHHELRPPISTERRSGRVIVLNDDALAAWFEKAAEQPDLKFKPGLGAKQRNRQPGA